MSARPRLQTLKPRVAVLSTSRIAVMAPGRPDATPRLRGRAGVERRAMWLAQHPLCVDCEARGITKMADVVDHITPLWQGGADDDSNLQSMCNQDHDAKTAREAAERAAGR